MAGDYSQHQANKKASVFFVMMLINTKKEVSLMEFTIIYRDSNEPHKKHNGSGKSHRKVPEVKCKKCGRPIPGTNAFRKNPRTKYHKECRDYVAHGFAKGFHNTILRHVKGEKFYKAFDETFGLKPL